MELYAEPSLKASKLAELKEQTLKDEGLPAGFKGSVNAAVGSKS